MGYGCGYGHGHGHSHGPFMKMASESSVKAKSLKQVVCAPGGAEKHENGVIVSAPTHSSGNQAATYYSFQPQAEAKHMTGLV